MPLERDIAGAGVFSLSGRLMLNAAGLDHILPPSRFTVTIHTASVIAVVVTCVVVTTMTATMPSAVAVQVAPAAAVPLMAGATPTGAPNTGGGGSLHHAGDLSGLAAGGLVLLAGLGITLAGMRRRRARVTYGAWSSPAGPADTGTTGPPGPTTRKGAAAGGHP